MADHEIDSLSLDSKTYDKVPSVSATNILLAKNPSPTGYFFVPELREVPCMSLSRLLDRYGNQEIHWLKIDVEGMERSVIESWQPSKTRPWIVVVESTEPLSSEPNFVDWEP